MNLSVLLANNSRDLGNVGPSSVLTALCPHYHSSTLTTPASQRSDGREWDVGGQVLVRLLFLVGRPTSSLEYHCLNMVSKALGWPGTLCVAEVDLELLVLCLPSTGITSMHHQA